MILRRFMQDTKEQNWFAVGLDVVVVVSLIVSLTVQTNQVVAETVPMGMGPMKVGVSNMQVDESYSDLSAEEIAKYLSGFKDEEGNLQHVQSILKYPNSAFITDVDIPNNPDVYPQMHGKKYPVVSFITFPAEIGNNKSYTFPFYDGIYGKFENMLAKDELPNFAKSQGKYPLVIFSHGALVHGMYDVGRNRKIASHGYIVIAINHGEGRLSNIMELAHMRPLVTKAVLDNLLEDDVYGPMIDSENIAINGFSLGGFTGFALAGGKVKNEPLSMTDERVTAVIATAPFMGEEGHSEGEFIFGDNNHTLSNVDVPVLKMFGTKDSLSKNSLAAAKLFKGPTYVIELVNQTHDIEGGSWLDVHGWELLFLEAYLKKDENALKLLRETKSMAGGNEDFQLMNYQRNLEK